MLNCTADSEEDEEIIEAVEQEQMIEIPGLGRIPARNLPQGMQGMAGMGVLLSMLVLPMSLTGFACMLKIFGILDIFEQGHSVLQQRKLLS